MVFDPFLLPGGGATEMAVGQELARCGPLEVLGVQRWPFVSLGKALEVIPRTLAQNCGANVIRQMTVLRAKHRNLDGNPEEEGLFNSPAPPFLCERNGHCESAAARLWNVQAQAV